MIFVLLVKSLRNDTLSFGAPSLPSFVRFQKLELSIVDCTSPPLPNERDAIQSRHSPFNERDGNQNGGSSEAVRYV